MTCIFLALLSVTFIISCHGAPPTDKQIVTAAQKSRAKNALKRAAANLFAKKAKFGVNTCPHLLENFHGQRSSTDSAADINANDLISGAQLLFQEGFTLAELHHENVRRAFHNQNEHCPDIPRCRPNVQYRTADGSCNNLNHPHWGQAGQAQSRLVPSAYDDGLSNPRQKSVFGSDLPNPRLVSNVVHAAPVGPEIRSSYITLHTFQMGQFLDHDLIATPAQSVVKDCCTSDEARTDTGNCYPIVCEGSDERFEQGYCMNFRRSSPVFCPIDSPQREQINGITSFIDASNVYGSADDDFTALRDNDGTGAFLKTAPGDRLPVNPNSAACVSNIEEGVNCSLAGDHRVDVVPSLTTYHTLFVREHNRIAAELRPFYSDNEELFQETRKILIGVMQKIVYEEFLPAFMSPTAIDYYNLSSSEPWSYNDELNPSISNGFGIAFRMGHSWIPRSMDVYTRDLQPLLLNNTEDTFFNPAMTYIEYNPENPGQPDSVTGMEGLAYGLSGKNSPDNDRHIEDAARNRLFEDSAGDAFDIVALNIQRGRDHGLPSYNAYRTFCGLAEMPLEWPVVVTDGLFDFTQEVVELLSSVYQSPQDIDLFTGLLSENPDVDGGIMGPTLNCMLGDQFMKLKFGDRFWYQGQANGFSPEQQVEIQQASMARILCDNLVFEMVHRNAFVPSDLVSCDEIASMDLAKFAPTGRGGGNSGNGNGSSNGNNRGNGSSNGNNRGNGSSNGNNRGNGNRGNK